MSKCTILPSTAHQMSTPPPNLPPTPKIQDQNFSWRTCEDLSYISEGYRLVVFVVVVITTRKRSLGQGNIFSSVCQEFCSRGGTLAGTPPGRYTPQGRYTSPGQVHPFWAGTPPPGRYTPGQVHPQAATPPGRYTLLCRYTPLGRYPPPGRYTPREQCMIGDTGNKRTVRILLECILVEVCRLIPQ